MCIHGCLPVAVRAEGVAKDGVFFAPRKALNPTDCGAAHDSDEWSSGHFRREQGGCDAKDLQVADMGGRPGGADLSCSVGCHQPLKFSVVGLCISD